MLESRSPLAERLRHARVKRQAQQCDECDRCTVSKSAQTPTMDASAAPGEVGRTSPLWGLDPQHTLPLPPKSGRRDAPHRHARPSVVPPPIENDHHRDRRRESRPGALRRPARGDGRRAKNECMGPRGWRATSERSCMSAGGGPIKGRGARQCKEAVTRARRRVAASPAARLSSARPWSRGALRARYQRSPVSAREKRKSCQRGPVRASRRASECMARAKRVRGRRAGSPAGLTCGAAADVSSASLAHMPPAAVAAAT